MMINNHKQLVNEQNEHTTLNVMQTVENSSNINKYRRKLIHIIVISVISVILIILALTLTCTDNESSISRQTLSYKKNSYQSGDPHLLHSGNMYIKGKLTWQKRHFELWDNAILTYSKIKPAATNAIANKPVTIIDLKYLQNENVTAAQFTTKLLSRKKDVKLNGFTFTTRINSKSKRWEFACDTAAENTDWILYLLSDYITSQAKVKNPAITLQHDIRTEDYKATPHKFNVGPWTLKIINSMPWDLNHIPDGGYLRATGVTADLKGETGKTENEQWTVIPVEYSQWNKRVGHQKVFKCQLKLYQSEREKLYVRNDAILEAVLYYDKVTDNIISIQFAVNDDYKLVEKDGSLATEFKYGGWYTEAQFMIQSVDGVQMTYKTWLSLWEEGFGNGYVEKNSMQEIGDKRDIEQMQEIRREDEEDVLSNHPPKERCEFKQGWLIDPHFPLGRGFYKGQTPDENEYRCECYSTRSAVDGAQMPRYSCHWTPRSLVMRLNKKNVNRELDERFS